MRLRQLVLACSLASLSLSAHVNALGLGEIKLKSLLNQPLEAEIQLLDTRDLSPEQIIINLASPADFERNGIDRLYFYSELQFSVDLNAPQGPLVRITSRTPVKEPYLNVLVEARWTAGRLLREYTLLMDLPTFDEERKPVVSQLPTTQKPVSQTSQIQSRPAPQQAGLPPRQNAPVASSRRTSSAENVGSSYKVRANDTLWEIASRARQGGDISVYQSMMALYKANPDAFINGNINRLRRGEVLRIPTSDEMTQLSRSLAATEFSQVSNDTGLGAQINASRRASTAPAARSDVSGRVKLSAPQAANSQGGAGSGHNTQADSQQSAQLASTMEELDKAKAENADLTNRVKSLEAQIETMERLISVSNEKLRSLQVNAEQSNQPQEDVNALPMASVDGGASSVSDDVSEDSSSVVSTESVANDVVVAPVVVEDIAVSSAAEVSSAAASSVSNANRVVLPAPKEPTLLETLGEKAPFIGGGLLALLGAGYWFYRRRQEDNDNDGDDLYEQTFESPQSESSDVELSTDADIADSDISDDTVIKTVAQTNDVVGEADIYLAYGKLDEAESLLLNALEKDEGNVDVRAKLLEIYSQQENLKAFDSHYAVLLPLVGTAALSQFADWRNAFDDGDVTRIKPFTELTSSEAGESDVSLDLSDFDLTIDDHQPSQDHMASELDLRESAENIDTVDFNFELDSDDTLTPNSGASNAPPSEEVSLGLSLNDDFNLDLEVDDIDLAALDTEINALDEQLVSSEDIDLTLEGNGSLAGTLTEEQDDISFELDENVELGEESLALFDESINDVALDDENVFAELDLSDEVASKVGEALALDSLFDEGDDLQQPKLDGSDAEVSLSVESSPLSDSLSIDDPLFEELDLTDNHALEAVVETDPQLVVDAAENDFSVDQLFKEALAELDSEDDIAEVQDDSLPISSDDFLGDDDLDADLDFLADADETATKLDLARAYMDMGDAEGAREILAEVLAEGNDEQKQDAESLLNRIV